MNRTFQRVLLVNPVYRGSHYHSPSLLSGLAYISEALNQAGIENRVLDMALGYTDSDLQHVIGEYRPDCVGLFLMTYRYRDHYRLMGSIRAAFPEIAIVVGGPHVSTMRERVLESCSAVDFGVVLEGEETIIELCTGRCWSDIGGLLWRADGTVRYNGDRRPNEKLDEVAFPSFSAFELNKYPYPGAAKEIAAMPIVTSRGCPCACIYCPVKAAIGRRMRFRSPENILREITARYEQGYRSLWIADDNFTVKRERVVQLCELIISSKLHGLRIGCGNGIRADLVDRELLTLMRQAGFWYLAFGIESGSDRVLKALRKGYRIEKVERGIVEACELGFEVTLFFVLGSPTETESDFRQTLDLALRHPVSDVRFYNLMPYPATELFEYVSSRGLFIRQPEEYLNDTISWQNRPVFYTPEMPLAVRKRLFRAGERARRAVKRRRLAAKIQQLGLPAALARTIAAVAVLELIERQWREKGIINRLVLALVRWRKTRSGFLDVPLPQDAS